MQGTTGNDNLQLFVKILAAENVNKSHTEYILQCSAGTEHHWQVRKRFSDFVHFHTAIKARQQITAKIPPKRLFGKLSDRVVQERKDGLDDYLRVVLRELESFQVNTLYGFLQVPQPLLRDVSQHPDLGTVGSLNIKNAPTDLDHQDHACRQIVEQVSELMVDVFQNPLPVKPSDAQARRRHYRDRLQGVQWPLEEGESLGAYLQRLVPPPNNNSRPRLNDGKAREEQGRAIQDGAKESLVVVLEKGGGPKRVKGKA